MLKLVVKNRMATDQHSLLSLENFENLRSSRYEFFSTFFFLPFIALLFSYFICYDIVALIFFPFIQTFFMHSAQKKISIFSFWQTKGYE